MRKLLWVLDTNVVLDLLYFDDVLARPILEALQNGQVHCAVTEATLEELRRVLTYPEFELAPARQVALFERYQSLSSTLASHSLSAALPVCSDPDDQKFLELAASSRANMLVSKDRALLKLRRRCAPLFQIMTPAEAVRWLEDLNSDSVAET